MQTEQLAQLIPGDFADDSRVWVYQCNRPFSDKEELEINEQMHHFYAQWETHGMRVKGWAKVLFKQFIVVMADESSTGVSGCSTDSMVRVIKSLEKQYSINLFDRMTITFMVEGKPQPLPYSQVQYAIDKGYINKDTPLFNNTVGTKAELFSDWFIPLQDSWLAKRVNLV
jgi:hypothetical protein